LHGVALNGAEDQVFHDQADYDHRQKAGENGPAHHAAAVASRRDIPSSSRESKSAAALFPIRVCPEPCRWDLSLSSF
jgi:hypothetical protein